MAQDLLKNSAMTLVSPPEVRAELLEARDLTDRLFWEVHENAWYDRPIPERHRLIFYLGHLEAFDWNLIGGQVLGRPAVDKTLDGIFAFGIDPPEGKLPDDQPGDWPQLQQALDYVRKTRAALEDCLLEAPPEALQMALEHRLMHRETLAYMLHELPYDRRITQDQQSGSQNSPAIEMVDIPGGAVTLGRLRNGQFGWDNEFDSLSLNIPRFAISKHKVTNGQYLEFVEAGGEPPRLWIRRDEKWRYRGYDGEIALPLDWPVYVNHYQASQFARWRKAKLPSEGQFQWVSEDAWSKPANSNFDSRDLISVTAQPGSQNQFGVAQLVGNGWEWTRSEFGPLPGFAPHPWYPGYSANFFDGDHFVVKGASPMTSRSLIRSTFRNWFRRNYSYAYTTFRIVEE